ncbi:putative serine C-palmitoyltransferase [Helianthus anomalus]
MLRCLLFAFDQLRDFFGKFIDWWKASNLQGYAPICLGLEDFDIRCLYLRIQDIRFLLHIPVHSFYLTKDF